MGSLEEADSDGCLARASGPGAVVGMVSFSLLKAFIMMSPTKV